LLAQYIVPLSIATVIAALISLGLAFFVWRRFAEARTGLSEVAATLEESSTALPHRLEVARASLAEQGAALEHLQWTMNRVDTQIEALTLSLAARRQTLHELRETLRGARVGVERLKQALRLITRAIELRRNILG